MTFQRLVSNLPWSSARKRSSCFKAAEASTCRTAGLPRGVNVDSAPTGNTVDQYRLEGPKHRVRGRSGMQLAHFGPNLLLPVVYERDELWLPDRRAGSRLVHALCLLKAINLPDTPNMCGGTEHRGRTEEFIGLCVDEVFPRRRRSSHDSPW